MDTSTRSLSGPYLKSSLLRLSLGTVALHFGSFLTVLFLTSQGLLSDDLRTENLSRLSEHGPLFLLLSVLLAIDLVVELWLFLLVISFFGINKRAVASLLTFGLFSTLARALCAPILISIYFTGSETGSLGFVFTAVTVALLMLILPVFSFLASTAHMIMNKTELSKFRRTMLQALALVNLAFSLASLFMLMFPLLSALVFFAWSSELSND